MVKWAFGGGCVEAANLRRRVQALLITHRRPNRNGGGGGGRGGGANRQHLSGRLEIGVAPQLFHSHTIFMGCRPK